MLLIDQTGHIIELKSSAKRIVSIVPSQTELLHDLGLEEEVIGITKFCIKPDHWFQSKKRIGGTKKLHLQEIIDLNPDLVLGNKEENTKEEIEFLREHGLNVWLSDIYKHKDNSEMILSIGEMTGKKKEALSIFKEIKEKFSNLEKVKSEIKVLYFIWKDPYFVVGKNTFIHSQLESLGFNNAASHLDRYPELANDQIKKLNPDYLFFSSEPYPFQEKHLEQLKKEFPNSKCIIVDGEMFSWTGSRQLHAPEYFRELVNQII